MIRVANAPCSWGVLEFAGARPKDRDSVDKRVIQQVKNRSGAILNCVAANGSTRCKRNAGSWPYIASNRRSITLPTNQDKISTNGYTNLENWLHSMDQQMAGVMSASSPASPPSLTVR